MAERISPSRFHEAGWRVLRDDACTYFATGSFAKGVELVEAIGQLAAAGDRHPDIDLRPEGVTVRLGTHGPLPTEEDLDLAGRISETARDLGVKVDLEGLQAVQVAIDALVIPEVLPFWQAVLGYRKVDDADLIDLRDHVMHAVGSRIFGFAQELFNDSPSAARETPAAMPPEIGQQFPYITELISAISHEQGSVVGPGCDDQYEFEFALDLLLDGIEELRQWELTSTRPGARAEPAR